jgi:hypothetical protein
MQQKMKVRLGKYAVTEYGNHTVTTCKHARSHTFAQNAMSYCNNMLYTTREHLHITKILAKLTPEKIVNFCCTQIMTQILTQIDQLFKYLCLHQI